MVTSVGNSTGQSILTALNAGGGIDANALATSLVNAEKVPQQNIIDAATTKANTTISSVGKVKSALTTLQTTLTALGDVKSFQTSAISSDTSKVTVAFNAGVSPTNFNNSINVQQIATPTTVLLPAVTSQDGSLLGTSNIARTFNLVTGSVQNSVANGVAMTLPASDQTGSIKINGIDTDQITISNKSLADNRKIIVSAINKISSQTGVTAVDNGDDTKGITLTAGDGRAITTSFNAVASPETSSVAFNDIVAGSSVTLGGLTLTATTDMTSQQVAAAFANRNDGVAGNTIGTYTSGSVSGQFSGSLSGWSSGSVAGSNVTFTATASGVLPNLLSTATTPTPTMTTTQPTSTLNQTSKIQFSSLAAGSSITIAGLTLTATQTMQAADVAAAFAQLTDGIAVSSDYQVNGISVGTFSTVGGQPLAVNGWNSGSVSGSSVVFTSSISGTVDNITVSSNTPSPVVSTIDGQSASQQQSLVFFNDLAAGNSVTVAGLTLSAKTAMTSQQVIAAFAGLNDGQTGAALNPYVANGVSATFSGTLNGWSAASTSPNGFGLLYTSSTSGTVSNIPISSTGTTPAKTTIQGIQSTFETSDITFQDLTAGKTVTVSGLTLTATSNMSAAEIANAFSSLSDGSTGNGYNGKGSFTGRLSGWNSGSIVTGADVNGNPIYSVRFTSPVAGNVSDLAASTNGTPLIISKSDGAQQTQAQSTINFSDMVAGNSVTIAGLTYTASSTLSASQVASAFGNYLSDPNFSGTLTGWSIGSPSGASLTFTATTSGIVPDIDVSSANKPPSAHTTQGVSATVENASVTFKALSAGSSVNVAGLTLTASTDMTDVQVAAAFANRLNGAQNLGSYSDGISSGVFSGSLAGWSSSAAAGANVNFNSVSTGNVPNLTVNASMPVPSVSTTPAINGVNKQSNITFTALAAGSSITIANLTYTASVNMSASQVAAVFSNLSDNYTGTGNFSGNLTGWSSGSVNGTSVNFTSTATGQVSDISVTNNAALPNITTIPGTPGFSSSLTGLHVGQYLTSLNGNSISGNAMSQPIITSPSTSVNGTIVINNTAISVSLTSNLSSNRTAIITAINAQTKTTGVTAVDSGSDIGGITLNSPSTQSISVSFPSVIGSSTNPTINPLSSSTTGIADGQVNAVTTLVGKASTAPSSEVKGNFKINGISITDPSDVSGFITLGSNPSTNQTYLINLINLKSSITGVTASANNSNTGITLTAADGRAIKTDLGPTFTEAQTGLKKNVLLSLDIDSSSKENLSSLKDKINAVSGMTASIVNGGTETSPLYYLSIKSGLGIINNIYADVTSKGSSIPLDAADTSNSDPTIDGLLGNYYSTTTLGQDAKITVDGVSITSSSNTFSKAIPNVTITAVAPTNGSPVTINSQTNTTALTSAINSLVSGYNQVISTMSQEMTYNTTDSTKNGGLANNPIAQTLISQLRAFTTQPITGYDGNSHALADIGVKTNLDGTLTLDTASFNSVLSSNPDLVAAVLASKQSVSDSRLAPGQIGSNAKPGVYTIARKSAPPTVEGDTSAANVTFNPLKAGANVTVGGLTFTASTDMTADNVAAAFAGLSDGATTGPSTTSGSYSGALTGWSSGTMKAGAPLNFTATNPPASSALNVTGIGWTINGDPASYVGTTLTAASTSSAAGISVFIPSDLAQSAADGFSATLNYSQGIIERFNNMINDATGTSSTLQTLTDDENKILSDLNTKQSTLDSQMASLLTRYQQQFTTLTTLLNQAKSTQSQLTDFQTAWSNSLKGN